MRISLLTVFLSAIAVAVMGHRRKELFDRSAADQKTVQSTVIR